MEAMGFLLLFISKDLTFRASSFWQYPPLKLDYLFIYTSPLLIEFKISKGWPSLQTIRDHCSILPLLLPLHSCSPHFFCSPCSRSPRRRSPGDRSWSSTVRSSGFEPLLSAWLPFWLWLLDSSLWNTSPFPTFANIISVNINDLSKFSAESFLIARLHKFPNYQ